MAGEPGASKTARPDADNLNQQAVSPEAVPVKPEAVSPEVGPVKDVPAGNPSGGTGLAENEPVAAGPAGPGQTESASAVGRAASFAARYAPAAAAAAAMLVLGCWGLDRHSSMGNDEVVTRWAALLGLHQLAHLLSHVDAVHGLYYLLMHCWMAVGTSPAVMRIPSVLAMVVAVALTAILARRLTGSAWAAIFAGLIMALTPSISFYAQTARSYAMVTACVLGATLMLLHALAAETAQTAGAAGPAVVRRWVAYGALVALGGYLNEMALLMLAAHAVTVALARPRQRTVAHGAAAAAGGAVLVLPLLKISSGQVNAIGWVPRPDLRAVQVLFHDYFGVAGPGLLLVCCALVALLPMGLPPMAAWRGTASRGTGSRGTGSAGAGEAAAGRSGRPGDEVPWWRPGRVSLPSVALPLLLLPAVLLMLESLVARPLYVDRYVLYGEAGAALLAGAGVHRIGRWLAGPGLAGPGLAGVGPAGRRALVVVPGVAVCLCTLLLQLGAQQRARTPESRLFDFGGPARYVAAHARTGDGVLYLTDFYRKAELGYPADFRRVDDFTLAVPPAQAGTFQGIDEPLPTIRRLMLVQRRIWVVGKLPSERPPGKTAQVEGLVLTTNFTLAEEHHFKGIVVSLWLRR